MNPMMIGGIIGAGAGVLKYPGDLEDQKRENELRFQTARYSPWTGMDASKVAVNKASLMGNIMQGATKGAAFGQSMGGMGGAEAAAPTGDGAMTPITQGTEVQTMNGQTTKATPMSDLNLERQGTFDPRTGTWGGLRSSRLT